MRKTSMLSILATVLLALTAVGGVAQARPVSGNSAEDQYVPAIPTAGGPQTLPPPASAAAPSSAQPAAIKNAHATSALAKATAPRAPFSGGSGPSGLGIVLPLIMAASLLGAAFLLWARRRSDGAAAQ